ncbi:MAG: hypothetical protein ACRC6V_11035 [Bacteroidales bacterium]
MGWPKDLLNTFNDAILNGVSPKAAPITPYDRRDKTLLDITDWVESNDGQIPKTDVI